MLIFISNFFFKWNCQTAEGDTGLGLIAAKLTFNNLLIKSVWDLLLSIQFLVSIPTGNNQCTSSFYSRLATWQKKCMFPTDRFSSVYSINSNNHYILRPNFFIFVGIESMKQFQSKIYLPSCSITVWQLETGFSMYFLNNLLLLN